MDKQQRIKNVLKKVGNCRKCPGLSPWAKFPPGAHGNMNADCLLLSIAPGGTSILKKKMWSGAGGTKIRKAAHAVGAELETLFYMTDTVKCQPLGNRDPFPGEQDSCTPYLDKEIRILGPKIILVFGDKPLEYVRTHFAASGPIPAGSITTLHNANGYLKIKFNDFTLIPLVHPANANTRFKPYSIYRQHLKEVFTYCIKESKK